MRTVGLSRKDVDEILRLLEASHFDELMLEMDGVKLTLRRGQTSQSTGPASATPPPSRFGASKPPVKPPYEPQAHADGLMVTAPMPGTFYRAPSPGASPFIEVGSLLEPDTVVGIIEVMKLMNAVPAGMRGRVVEICADNAAGVEYGQPLVRAEPIP
jgi:acetyl-CoA carboxylase biotin carboxyl carrier protein